MMEAEALIDNAAAIWNDIQRIRADAPLVHNITNFVVMNTTANALLALGASPVMSHAEEEVAEMAALARALVINIGTLSRAWVHSMIAADRAAHERGIPIVLDPVGAGGNALPHGNGASPAEWGAAQYHSRECVGNPGALHGRSRHERRRQRSCFR